ncbi:hypothetical protein MMB19_30435 (plasmid) [Ralstonia insidiosa]|nr:hypothetical protein MMB19_30435 [Ralstonia insidiosa]
MFSFDGDAAGRRAAAAALATVLPFAVDANRIEFLFLPAEHDPDSFVRAHGLDAFKNELAKAVPLASYLQQIISEAATSSTPRAARSALRALAPIGMRCPMASAVTSWWPTAAV